MIYFIAAGPNAVAIKIGFTADVDPYSRLATLQTGNHLELFLVAFGPGSLFDEQYLHRLHKGDAIRGEWFKPTVAVMSSAVQTGLITSAIDPSRRITKRELKVINRALRWADGTLTEDEYQSNRIRKALKYRL